MKKLRNVLMGTLSLTMALSTLTIFNSVSALANASSYRGSLNEVKEAVVDRNNDNIVYVTFNDDVTAKITFLEDGIFRYNVDPSGVFSKYASPRSNSHTAKIQQYPDESEYYSHPSATVDDNGDTITISVSNEETKETTKIIYDKDTAKMSVMVNDTIVLQEKESLSITNGATVQTLIKNDGENFYGGGTQNGRFVHTGQEINIANESGWVDGQVASPNPFYWTTSGYGVLRNTFANGKYNFGKNESSTVTATHNEAEFDAYFFVSDAADAAKTAQKLLQGYYHVTGNPVLLPEYGFYEGHLNCYNRDAWNSGTSKADPSAGNKVWSTTNPDGSVFQQTEAGGTGYVIKEGLKEESLNGKAPTVFTTQIPEGVTTPYEFSAQSVLNRYFDNDMPIGYFVPNDGYGCGYGQNGYNMTGGVDSNGNSSEDRIAAVDANVNNLAEFTQYANSLGVATGLWTQSQLSPTTNKDTLWHLLRDFEKEVTVGGITTLKTDVAWVGSGYSMQLDGVKRAYDIVTTTVNTRPNIISLDGWAGSQRYNSVWTGDQAGGNWEYIRFHIPTYIGQSLAGNPNVGSDMDGIHGGAPLIATRDYQWKAFTPQMLNMDGWGTYAKVPHAFADPYKSVSRMYLKLKAQLMPYIYTSAASAANIDTGNEDTGLPMVRAMFLEFPDDSYAFSKNMQYQYMFGDAFLVAPVYQNTAADGDGNDIRNDIYLPDGEVWIDYFTGQQYAGGAVINNFAAPLWKLPLFVKNGSIVPMYEENNTPDKIDKNNRIVEFWPAGSTSYTAFEDDGKYIENNTTEDKDYGTIDNISYGEHVSINYTSVVDNDTATLTAGRSNGIYKGYTPEKNTTFVVNVSKEPTSVIARNGSEDLKQVKANSKEEVLNADVDAGTFVYYYDESPAIETYALDSETKIKEMVADVKVSPKLYVKFAETNAEVNEQQLIIHGFVNDGHLPADEINEELSVPQDLKADEVSFDYVTLSWGAVKDAQSYDVEADGIIYSLISSNSYTHKGLSYLTDHTYRVRAVNQDGYSEWSEPFKAQTEDNPYRNVPSNMSVSYDNGEVPTAYAGKFANMVDGDDTSEYSSRDAGVFNGKSFTIDMKKVYTLEKLEYAFRKDYGNGTIQKLGIAYSTDGVTWKTYADEITLNLTNDNCPLGSSSVQNANARYTTIEFDQPFKARYLKLTTVQTSGGFLQAYEIRPYHADGETGILPGDYDNNGTINGNDEVWLENHHPDAAGSRKGQAIYDAAPPSGTGAHDLNENGIFDAADIAILTSQLNGGVKEKLDASGIVAVVPSKTSVSAGENFTVDVYGSNLKNVYAFDFELTFEHGALSSASDDFKVESSTKTSNMKIYENLHEGDANDRVYAAFTNIGDQALVNGDIKLATVALKANKELQLNDLKASFSLLVGSSLNYVNALEFEAPQIPEVSESRKLAAHTDIVDAQAKSTGPDGSDIWSSLDGNPVTYTNSNYNGENGKTGIELAHPQIYTFTLSKEMEINKVGVQARSAGHLNQLVSYEVWVSNNGKDYTKAASQTVTTGDMTYVEFNAVKTQYVQLQLYAGENVNCVSTSEVEIWSAGATTPAGTALNLNHMTITPEADDQLQPNMGVDKLVDGKVGEDDYRYEFKWGDSQEVVGAQLPHEIRYDFHQSQTLASLRIQIRHNGDILNTGALKDFELYGIRKTSDGEVKTLIGSYTMDTYDKTFDLKNQTYDAVILNCKTSQGGVAYKLNIDETTFTTGTASSVTGIEFAADTPDEIYVGRLTPILANVLPADAANKLYTVESDNDNVRVITYSDGKNYYYSLLALKKDIKANITVKSLADEKISVTKEISVSNGAYLEDLKAAIAQTEALSENLYTAESYERVSNALEDANNMLSSDLQDKVDKAELNLLNAIAMLEFKGSDTSREDSVHHIDEKQMTVTFVTSNAAADGKKENIIDNQADTIWHSAYGANDSLPVEVIVDLGYVYDLEQVDYLPRQNSSNGHITHYRIEVSTNGTDYVPVVEGYLSNNGYELDDKTSPKKIKFEPVEARYVKFIAIESIGNAGAANNRYASIAELDFYGITEVAATKVEFINTEEKMFVGNELQLVAMTTPSNASLDGYIWASDNIEVATVDENGKVTALQEGKANITVKSADETITASILITVTAADKTDLAAAIKDIEAYIGLLDNEQIKAYLTAELNKAQEVYGNDRVTDEDVLKALNDLNAAKATAEMTVTILVQADDLINTDLSKYDPEGQEEFKQLVEETKKLMEDPITNVEALKTKVSELEAQKAQLIKLDVTALNNLIAVAEDIDMDKYVDDAGKEAFMKALEDARKVAQAPVSVQQIKDAEKALVDSESGLTLSMNDETEESLRELYEAFKALNKSEYTESSIRMIEDVMKDLEFALNNGQTSQTDASELLKAAAEKYASLEKVSHPSTPETPMDPNNPAQAGESESTDKPSTTTESETPSTSDSGMIAVYVSLFAVSVLALAVCLKRKKEVN
ncbi:discoidin domain-containing protein [uncultured Traorella sp.]|uniref:discoidin domain-containing protein n=1 Tax=uncultured Traorella sp. TaxID=1929048 RepID=UPI0025F17297|nr:discoidin domain-containing protein [uncultured Traorella sp.]